MERRFTALLCALAVMAACAWAQDLALKGGTILTITNGTIENGTIIIQNGKITAVGKDVQIPNGIKVIDVTGKYVMPGIIDSHSHIALTDINEATDPVTPQIWMWEALEPGSDSILKTLAGGVTTVKTMHGSANIIGGVNVTIKLKYDRSVEELIIQGVRQQLKMALGENPKRLYGSKGRSPSTRMGNAYVARKAFVEAREYKAKWDKYEKDKQAGKKDLSPPKKDLQMETLKMVLEKKLSIDCHTYRAEEIAWIIDFCKEFDIDLLQLSHCIDGYKVADIMAEAGVFYGGWVDSWGFKEEAYDGCPYGLQILYDSGAKIVINSDSPVIGRYLFLEASKVLKYTDIPENEALKMITLNPAESLELGDRIGSLEKGKDGDIAVFDKHPLDSTTKCLMTIIEGEIFFDFSKESITVKGGSR
ncbi:MAG: amidohydrolase family protein [Candidatus Aminicenantes bacterium]|nr:amidohydrolase family protein [Candidatus Aminicenantes bacterium]MDH5385281.1 amidohydrolase family protein [Candidatus Aminicenantes bacterium]MDH5744344.1 amidohydrolase family protein [Candidatus Aminicenantes bacterium]